MSLEDGESSSVTNACFPSLLSDGNRLSFDSDICEAIVFHTVASQQIARWNEYHYRTLGCSNSYVMGVGIDKTLSSDEHIDNKVVAVEMFVTYRNSSYYPSKMRWLLATVIITCPLECCTSLLYGISAPKNVKKLPWIQNALYFTCCRHERNTTILAGLHHLPVDSRIIDHTLLLCIHTNLIEDRVLLEIHFQQPVIQRRSCHQTSSHAYMSSHFDIIELSLTPGRLFGVVCPKVPGYSLLLLPIIGGAAVQRTSDFRLITYHYCLSSWT